MHMCEFVCVYNAEEKNIFLSNLFVLAHECQFHPDFDDRIAAPPYNCFEHV